MQIVKENNQFHAYQDGHSIGYIQYYVQDNHTIVSDHTYINADMRGLKIAEKLLDALANYARENNLKIVPQCSYVLSAFSRFPQKYQDININE